MSFLNRHVIFFCFAHSPIYRDSQDIYIFLIALKKKFVSLTLLDFWKQYDARVVKSYLIQFIMQSDKHNV